MFRQWNRLPHTSRALALTLGLTGLVTTGWIAREHQVREALERADRDPQTGFLRRHAWETTVDRTLRARPRSSAMLVFDLDGLKTLNDEHGHCYGDAAIHAFSAAVRRQFPGHPIGRLGGDEFALLSRIPPQPEQPAPWLDSCYDQIRTELPVGFSLGVAVPSHWPAERTRAALLHQADLAMYAAKRHRTGWQIYDRHHHGPAVPATQPYSRTRHC